jgi:hypothetical protein
VTSASFASSRRAAAGCSTSFVTSGTCSNQRRALWSRAGQYQILKDQPPGRKGKHELGQALESQSPRLRASTTQNPNSYCASPRSRSEAQQSLEERSPSQVRPRKNKDYLQLDWQWLADRIGQSGDGIDHARKDNRDRPRLPDPSGHWRCTAEQKCGFVPSVAQED